MFIYPFPFTFVPFWLYKVALCFRLESRLLRHYGVKAQALPILPGVN
jgi:hypothetical protein